jgi:hypothetical protein
MSAVQYQHIDVNETDEFVLKCRLFEAAFGGFWGYVQIILQKHPEWVNDCNPVRVRPSPG